MSAKAFLEDWISKELSLWSVWMREKIVYWWTMTGMTRIFSNLHWARFSLSSVALSLMMVTSRWESCNSRKPHWNLLSWISICPGWTVWTALLPSGKFMSCRRFQYLCIPLAANPMLFRNVWVWVHPDFIQNLPILLTSKIRWKTLFRCLKKVEESRRSCCFVFIRNFHSFPHHPPPGHWICRSPILWYLIKSRKWRQSV